MPCACWTIYGNCAVHAHLAVELDSQVFRLLAKWEYHGVLSSLESLKSLLVKLLMVLWCQLFFFCIRRMHIGFD